MMKDVLATQVLLDWWQAKRGDRSMPSRADLDPVELKAILPSFILFDVKPAPSGQGHVFTYRLTGTDIDSRLGIRLTGLTLDEAPFGPARDKIQEQYEAATAEARPILCTHNMVVGDRYVEYDRLVVPLSDAAGRVTALAGAVDFKCCYQTALGRPPACAHPDHCDRLGFCLSRSRPA